MDGSGQGATGGADGAAFEKILASIARDLANVGTAQFDRTLTASLQPLVEGLGFDRSTVMLFTEHGRRLQVTHCWARDGLPRESPGDSLDAYPWFTQQIRRGHLFRLASAADLPQAATAERRYAAAGGVKATVAVPLVVGDTVVGAIAFGTFRTERPWPGEMAWRLRLVGELVGLAVARHQHTRALHTISQVAHQAAPAGQGAAMLPMALRRQLSEELLEVEERERRRISHVLHEDVMQLLFGLSLTLERLQRPPTQTQSALLEQAGSVLQDAIRKLGQLVLELRPATPAQTGLLDGLRWLADQMRQVYGLAVAVAAGPGIEPVRAETQAVLLTAAHKLLDNIAAHSHSAQATIEIERLAGTRIRLTVSDQGTGFEAQEVAEIPSHSFGLFTIREQAALLGGSVEVTSSPGHGTRAVVTVPG